MPLCTDLIDTFAEKQIRHLFLIYWFFKKLNCLQRWYVTKLRSNHENPKCLFAFIYQV